MARKKSQYLDGFSSDSGGSSNEGDAYEGMTREERDEAELMNGYGKKRKRSGKSKDEAIYGVFAEGDDDDGDAEARGKVSTRKQTNFLRGQAFVPASSKAADVVASDGSDESEDASASGKEDDDGSEADDDMQAILDEAEDEETAARPGLGGIASSSKGRQGFAPASFVSSRGGIGSRRATDDGEDLDVRETDAAAAPTAGLGSRAGTGGFSTPTPGIGSSRGGIGSSRGGIGSSSASISSDARPSFPTFAPSTLKDSGMPASFGAAPALVEPSDAFAKKEKKPKRSFLPGADGSSVPKTNINFGSGLGGGFNPAAYLASMGWTGGGLGENGEGMLNPIEVQLRPEKAGIAFGGRKERTKQAKEEAKRRGEEVSSDEDERAARRNKGKGDKKKEKKEQAAELRQAWTTRERKPRKPKVEHRTYEQIIEEAGGVVPTSDAGVGQIIDARSKEMKEVASLASALAQHAVPTSDSTRLPELRHNLRLIADNSKQTLDALAKEGAGIFERRRWLQREYDESRRRREKEAIDLARLKVVLSLVRELEATGKSTLTNSAIGLEAFEPLVERIQQESDADIENFGLDEALAGALAPLMKRLLGSWDPLQDSDGISATLHKWRRALRSLGGASAQADSHAVDRYGSSLERKHTTARNNEIMLPFEALLWHLWMPRIRSALNNDWKVHHPRAAVAVLTAWQPLLPRYIWDNVLDQILLPKVRKAVHDWEPRTARAPLHYILFPWLPLLGERIDETMSEARRRIRALLKSWRPKEEAIPQHLDRWREFFPKSEWNSMFLTQVVPKLASYLASTFSVNPRSQDMAPLEKALAWRELLRPSILSRLLEGELFPKWLTTLHTWLVQPGVDLGEVAKWYSFWKGWLPSEVAALPGIEAGFAKGIALINQAVEMGEDRRGLPKPDLTPLSRSSSSGKDTGSTSASHAPSRRSQVLASSAGAGDGDGDAEEVSITFRSIVEDRAAELDLLVLSLNRSHAQTGLPLLRIAEALDGKSGATFYVQEDIVWVEERDRQRGTSEWVPVGVEELMKRAKGARR